MTKFRIKELAQARGWTQQDLAQYSNTRISTLQNLWQNKAKEPRASTLLAIADALGVSIQELYVTPEENSTTGNRKPAMLVAAQA